MRNFSSPLLAFIILALFSTHSLAEVLVKTVTAKQQPYAKPIHISGIIEHKTQQKLAFKVPGFVEKIYVKQGERIRQGQLLASLDLEEIEAELQQAKANAVLAKNELNRAQRLFDKNTLSQAQLDQAQAQLDIALAAERKARFNLRHAEIKAPNDGIVLKRLIETNELVSAGNPAFLVSNQADGWIIKTSLADKDFTRLQFGDAANVSIPAVAEKVLPAKVSELAASSDAFQTYAVEFSIEQDNVELSQGLISHLTIYPQQTQSVILLPSSAMVRATRPQDSHALYSEVDIFVVNEKQQAELRKVIISGIDKDKIIVTKGLAAGEEVVTLGAAYLSHLQAVKVDN